MNHLWNRRKSVLAQAEGQVLPKEGQVIARRRTSYVLLRFPYLEVLKPRETGLLTFLGLSSALLAAAPMSASVIGAGGRLILAVLAIFLGSGAVNGLTNYLDREVDGRMLRTRRRALPSGRIRPPERVLPYLISLLIVSLALAWFLHPYAFLGGLGGTVCALVARKTWATHVLGALSGAAPVLVGWFSLRPEVNLTLVSLTLLVLLWVPLHVWSLMLAYREDYLQAGVRIFPVTWSFKQATPVLLGLASGLFLTSLLLERAGGFGPLYLGAALTLGVLVMLASLRLLLASEEASALRLFQVCTYPYLGLLFVALLAAVYL